MNLSYCDATIAARSGESCRVGSSATKTATRSPSRYRWAMVFDQGEGSDILDAILSAGFCVTCGTPWSSVIRVEGGRPVRVEGGCPNEVCIIGDG